MKVKAEIVRDKTLDWIERLFEDPGFDLACRAVIVLAILYFLPVIITILAR
jgi:hypothetical protein